MTVYADLSPYAYFGPVRGFDARNIGWLGPDGAHGKVTSEPEFDQRLKLYCLWSVNQSRGVHECELCETTGGVRVEINGKNRLLGTAEIVIFGRDQVAYLAPDLIFHYVTEHGYQPPDEFCTAVMQEPLPGSKEHLEKLKNLLQQNPTMGNVDLIERLAKVRDFNSDL